MPRLSIQLPDGSEKTIVLPKNGEYFARIGRDAVAGRGGTPVATGYH